MATSKANAIQRRPTIEFGEPVPFDDKDYMSRTMSGNDWASSILGTRLSPRSPAVSSPKKSPTSVMANNPANRSVTDITASLGSTSPRRATGAAATQLTQRTKPAGVTLPSGSVTTSLAAAGGRGSVTERLAHLAKKNESKLAAAEQKAEAAISRANQPITVTTQADDEVPASPRRSPGRVSPSRATDEVPASPRRSPGRVSPGRATVEVPASPRRSPGRATTEVAPSRSSPVRAPQPTAKADDAAARLAERKARLAVERLAKRKAALKEIRDAKRAEQLAEIAAAEAAAAEAKKPMTITRSSPGRATNKIPSTNLRRNDSEVLETPAPKTGNVGGSAVNRRKLLGEAVNL